MIYNWFLNNKFIDSDLNWIGNEYQYIIQLGDQIDKYGTEMKNMQTNTIIHNFRRERIHNERDPYDDIRVLLFFDYLDYISTKIYGSSRVMSVNGNHELLNLEYKFHHAIKAPLLPGNDDEENLFYEQEKSERMKIINNYLIQKIIFNRPILIKFNNLVLCHGGIDQKTIDNFKNISNLKFNDQFIIENFITLINNHFQNKYDPFNYGNDDIYTKLIFPVLWTREYAALCVGNRVTDNVQVIGHNSLDDVIYCTPELCLDLKEYEKRIKDPTKVKMIKVDTGIRSRKCENGITNIFTSKVNFNNFNINSLENKSFRFVCSQIINPGPELNLKKNLHLINNISKSFKIASKNKDEIEMFQFDD